MSTTITPASTRPAVNSTTLSHEWRTRKPEECYRTLDDLRRAAAREKAAGVERDYRPRQLAVASDSDGSDAIALLPLGGSPLALSHHAFGQLSGLAKAPAAYLRSLPAELVADCLTVGLARRDRAENPVQLLANAETETVRALTGEHYSRLWTADLIELMQSAEERSGRRYVTPPAWSNGDPGHDTWTAGPDDVGPWTLVKAGDTVRAAGLYYSPSDGKDTFIFRLNTERQINLPGNGSGFRALMFWNSEGGAASFGGAQITIDTVCGNHILWGLRDVSEFRFRHVGDGLSARSHREILSAFRALDAAPWETAILKGASAHILGDTVAEVEQAAVRATRLPLSTIQAARAAASSRDYGNPNSAYAVASALTEYAQTRETVEARVDTDRAAARLYSITAN